MLGALEGGELPAQVVREPFTELLLVELHREVRRAVDVVVGLAGVGVPELREGPLDSRSFGVEELTCAFGID